MNYQIKILLILYINNKKENIMIQLICQHNK
jgi:hypothetical protein